MYTSRVVKELVVGESCCMDLMRPEIKKCQTFIHKWNFRRIMGPQMVRKINRVVHHLDSTSSYRPACFDCVKLKLITLLNTGYC